MQKMLKSLLSNRKRLGFYTTLVLIIATITFISLKAPPQPAQQNIATPPANTPQIVKPQQTTQKTFSAIIKAGDSLSTILTNSDISGVDSYDAMQALRKIFRPSQIQKKDLVNLYYTVSNDTNKVKLDRLAIKSPTTRIEYNVTRNSKGIFYAKAALPELFTKLKHVEGTITRSLFEDAVAVGTPASIIMEFIQVYSFDIDFQRDIQKNTKFKILYESYYDKDDEFVSNGEIVYASIRVNNREFDIYRYTNAKGETLFFDKQGYSTKKSLLKTPVKGARITSGFGYRHHPILGYSKLHKGIDFAAPRGTPIFAAGNGIVRERRWNGAYGRFILIRHNNTYSTSYAHMSRFSNNFKRGSKVKQGQIIGYVGTTGRSTGPHLHYEVRKFGKQMNPQKLKFKSQIRLDNKEMKSFSKHSGKIDFIINNAF
jgi:murein DD-endopeptidase MepM/ murein hydrolase activator NlpD